jgi:hypothetical protein
VEEEEEEEEEEVRTEEEGGRGTAAHHPKPNQPPKAIDILLKGECLYTHTHPHTHPHPCFLDIPLLHHLYRISLCVMFFAFEHRPIVVFLPLRVSLMAIIFFFCVLSFWTFRLAFSPSPLTANYQISVVSSCPHRDPSAHVLRANIKPDWHEDDVIERQRCDLPIAGRPSTSFERRQMNALALRLANTDGGQ